MPSVTKNLRWSRPPLFAAALLMVLGCQGEGGESPPSQEAVNSLQLRPALLNVLDQEGFIDLKPYISGSGAQDGAAYQLEVMASSGLEQHCIVNSINDDGFYFQKDQDVCVYQYRVTARYSNGDVIAKQSQARILSSSEQDIALKPISQVVEIGAKKTVQIDLEPGYELAGLVALEGDIQVTTLDGGRIEIDASNTTHAGLAVIDYKVKAVDGSLPPNSGRQNHKTLPLDAIKIGQLYVTVQNQGYVSVSAGSGHFPNDGVKREYALNEEVIIDISPFVQAGSFDYQLFEVQSLTATVESLTDPSKNKSFKFKASEPGRHYVYYMVYDHTTSGSSAGGYAGNLITVDVALPKSWQKIAVNHDLYSAPDTYHEALSYGLDRFGVTLSKHFDSRVEMDVVTMPKDQARGYCNFFGGVMRLSRLQKLLDGNLIEKEGWPTDKPYVYIDDITLSNQALDMRTGQIVPGASQVYVSCVQNVRTELVETLDGVSGGADFAVVTFKINESYPVGRSRPSKGAPLTARVLSGNAQIYGGSLGATKFSNHNGLVSFYFTSLQPGDSRIAFSNENGPDPNEVVITFSSP